LLALLPKVPRPAGPLRPPLFFTSAEVRRIPEGSVALVASFPGLSVRVCWMGPWLPASPWRRW
jgi:hypothetical protein